MGLIKINIEMLNKIVLGKVTLQYFSSVHLFGPRLYSYEIERNKSIICSQCQVRFIFNLINKPLFYQWKKRERKICYFECINITRRNTSYHIISILISPTLYWQILPIYTMECTYRQTSPGLYCHVYKF